MRKTLFNIALLFIAINTVGQDPFKKNDIYLEAGGNGLFGSLNYERQLTKEPGIGARIGVGFYTENAFYLTTLVGINYLFNLKNNRSFIDAGLGVTWARTDGAFIGSSSQYTNGDRFVNFVPSIGYRRHTLKNVMWRISLTPVINKYTGAPWLGLSIGKRF
ncbi:MAG TPA: hypothetical protein VMY77_17950 [Chitinophagaceae bacterium]|nr:hypothetical protein [Chitinophagaceae bacterium]